MNSEKVMGEGKAAENRKEDKKAFGKFIVIMIIALLGGAVTGFFTGYASKGNITLGEGLNHAVKAAAPYGNIVFTTVTLILTAVLIRQSKKLYKSWDGENEQKLAEIDGKLSIGLLVVSLNQVITFFFIGACTYAMDFRNFDSGRAGFWTVIILSAIGFIYAVVVNLLLQKEIVNLTKEINPEKEGSIYDMHFQKKWHDSCDELERLNTYKACYKSFTTTTYACMVLWAFCNAGILLWNFGLMPMAMVLVIWLIMTVSCYLEAMRLEKRHN